MVGCGPQLLGQSSLFLPGYLYFAIDFLTSLLTFGLCSTGYALHLEDATDGGVQGEIHRCERQAEESRERYINVRDRGLRALNQAINDPYLSSPAYRCEKEGGKGVLSSHKRPISESSSIFRSFNNKT